MPGEPPWQAVLLQGLPQLLLQGATNLLAKATSACIAAMAKVAAVAATRRCRNPILCPMWSGFGLRGLVQKLGDEEIERRFFLRIGLATPKAA